MGNLSEHFSRAEFECRGKDGCSPRYPTTKMLEALEKLRTLAGNRPLVIVSGYRCKRRNREVGGAPRSRHLVGDAVDLRPGTVTVEQALAAGFRGIGSQGRWATHVDLRPSPARWEY